jgi:hypothetical protein
MECQNSNFYVHHNHRCVCGGKSAVDEDFECCDVSRGSRDVAGVVEHVAPDGYPDAFLFFFVGFIITNYFDVSDLSVFWDVCKFDKETCVGSRNVPNALKEVSDFVAKTSFPK